MNVGAETESATLLEPLCQSPVPAAPFMVSCRAVKFSWGYTSHFGKLDRLNICDGSLADAKKNSSKPPGARAPVSDVSGSTSWKVCMVLGGMEPMSPWERTRVCWTEVFAMNESKFCP